MKAEIPITCSEIIIADLIQDHVLFYYNLCEYLISTPII